MWSRIGIGLLVIIAALWTRNASLLAKPIGEGVKIIAHRGIHHTYSREGLTNQTCTATRIFLPEHDFIENTIPSFEAAVAAGADVIELDIHPTTDGHFAVFHDWTLDCRTDGEGVTRRASLDYIKTLDAGYGYTADDGETFPLRGKGVGMIPSLTDVFEAFPDGQFLINFKSNDPEEGAAFAALMVAHPEWRERLWGVYGAPGPIEEALKALPGLRYFHKPALKACAKSYLLTGWTGNVPKDCRNRTLALPISHARLAWGWPRAFEARMTDAGSDIILMGEYGSGDPGTPGIDNLEMLARVPESFGGYIWTDRVEIIGPALKGEDAVWAGGRQ